MHVQQGNVLTKQQVTPYLFTLGIECLLDLVLTFVCESDAEETQQVAVSRLDVNVRLYQRLPT